MKLCPDPVVQRLREVFEANILKVPEERFLPLVTIFRANRKNRYWGDLSQIVEGDVLDLYETISQSRMSDVSGKISRSTNVAVGLKILEGFLKGFGLPATSIAAQFAGASKVAFSFKNVVRHYIAPASMVEFLNGTPLDTNRSDVQQVIGGEAQLYVIDSIITSSDFSIHVTASNSNNLNLDIPAIQGLVAQSNTAINVQKETDTALTFQGDKGLTFAFTCLLLQIDPAGRVTLRPKDLPKRVFNMGAEELAHELLTEEAEMMVLE